MPSFHYSALSATGELIRGDLTAADSAAAIAQLHARALLPIAAEAERSARWHEIALFPVRALPGRQLALASAQLARLLGAGLPLDRALEILANLAGGARVARVWRGTLGLVRDGASLAEAMDAQAPAFPRSFVSMVRAGEAGGALPVVLARVADFLTRAEAMRQQVVSALIYPALLAVVAIGSVGIVLTLVLPQFAPMFRAAGAQLPEDARLLMRIGDALRADGWMLLPALLACGLGWRVVMRRPDMALRRDRLVLALPLLRSLVGKLEIGRFSRTLGVLLASGVAAPAALTLSGAVVRNRALASAITIVARRFKEGEGLSAPLARSGRFPPLATQLIRIGEETGRLEDMLGEVAALYEQDVQRLLDRLLAVLVPGLTIVMGLIVALIVSTILTALISINNLAM